MNHVRRICSVAMLLAAAYSSASYADVVLAPGGSAALRDRDGHIILPASSLASDASLNGTIVDQASRALSMTLLHVDANPFLPPAEYIFTAVIEDWVVRRADTGTLDFYSRIDLPGTDAFGGWITRSTAFSADMIAPLAAGYRGDLPVGGLAGIAPSGLARSADGKVFDARFFWNDNGGSHPVFGASAPVYFRSNATNYVDNVLGSVNFSYTGEGARSDTGSAALGFFAPSPVPEPATLVLMIAGLGFIWAVRGRRNPD